MTFAQWEKHGEGDQNEGSFPGSLASPFSSKRLRERMQSFALAISGPVRKVAHCEFQYIPYDCGMDNPKRSHNAWIAAVKPATATHKRVVQPIRVLLP